MDESRVDEVAAFIVDGLRRGADSCDFGYDSEERAERLRAAARRAEESRGRSVVVEDRGFQPNGYGFFKVRDAERSGARPGRGKIPDEVIRAYEAAHWQG